MEAQNWLLLSKESRVAAIEDGYQYGVIMY
jgi:hypothetical protein